MPPKQCYSNRAYLRHMVYFSFPPVVTLSDGDTFVLVMSYYCVHTQLFPLLEMTDALIISPNSFFVTLSGGDILV